MGLCVIAALPFELSTVGAILLVAIGLGAVIFVHELGHFLVAKMCGVKCEKFFIGFDIGGIKLSRKWGETEYGIGILPLGGYVKMLGQDDNPANIAEQVEQSKALEGSPDAKAIVGPNGETLYVDRRSYLAKSVPQRMAIISAGVVMNIIFAFIFAFWAYGIGVPIQPCVVSSTTPGAAAWNIDLKPGDEIIKIGDRENPSFDDLRSNVLLGDMKNGVPIIVKRAGSEETEEIKLKPTFKGKLPMIGVALAETTRLERKNPTLEGSPAFNADAFKPRDEIVAVDGQPIKNYFDLAVILIERADEPLKFTVRRGGEAPKGDFFGQRVGGKELTVTVAPNPLHRLGLVMAAGPISAVQAGSPADLAGIKVGDALEKVNGKRIGAAPEGEASLDPMMLPDTIAQFARNGEAVTLTLRRAGSAEDAATEDLLIEPRKVSWIEGPAYDSPLSVPALGIAYPVDAVIQSVMGGSSAEEAGLQKGDQIVKAEWQNLPKSLTKRIAARIEFGTDKRNWPVFFDVLQSVPPHTEVKLTYVRGGKEREAIVATRPVDGAYWPERGFDFAPVQRLRIASTWGEQAELAFDETISSLTMVYRFLGKLWEGQIPITGVGGPVTIAGAAFFAADEGLGKLLIFLTMLSANLAVLNFLPIPLLDGGHMVFLIYEGIRGRPANERFVIAMHTIGFVFIISLMLFVFGLDLGFIDRGF